MTVMVKPREINLDGIFGDGLTRSHPTDLQVDWARSLMDIPHRLLVMPSWDLPVFRGRHDLAGKILGALGFAHDLYPAWKG